MLSIAFGQSKYYIDNLSENIKRGHRQKLKQGLWPQMAPLGYLNNKETKQIYIDKGKAPLIKKTFELYATGKYTLKEIREIINDLGLRGRRGNNSQKCLNCKLAEREGFEPSVGCNPTAVFETAPIIRSGTSPKVYNKLYHMEKVVVAMSGGIDSSVAAYLLKEKGMAVEGVFFLMFDEPSNLEFLKKTTNYLQIKLHMEDVREKFEKEVMQPFFEGYKKGITPNPCVICNKKIKFPMLKLVAERLQARYFATGHYARIENHNNVPHLLKGIDKKKDQSYFLYSIDRTLLSQLIFPLGTYTKQQTRQIAEKIGIPSTQAEESTEVCFLKNKRYYDFIKPFKEGPIIEMSTGKILGKHRGIHLYTMGQRKRLGISSPYPLYVVKIDPMENAIYVDRKEKAFLREFFVHELNWLSPIKTPFNCHVKIRYAMEPEEALVVLIDEDTVKVTFHEPQFAPTPGQSAVFYRGDFVLGGGVIKALEQDF